MTDTGSRTARTRRSTAERLLSWGSPPFQRSSRRAVARSLVPRSPFVVGLRPDPGVFPTAGGCDRSKTVAPPLLGLVPLQSMTGSAAGALSGSDASRGVSRPYSASGHGSPLIRDLPRPGSGAATGFRTLLPRPSPASLRPVRAGNAHGVPPSKLSPPAEPRRLSASVALLPLAVRTVGVAPGATSKSRTAPASGLCSPRESVAEKRGLAAPPLAAPLGFPRSRA
jgi:hypothetical protein